MKFKNLFNSNKSLSLLLIFFLVLGAFIGLVQIPTAKASVFTRISQGVGGFAQGINNGEIGPIISVTLGSTPLEGNSLISVVALTSWRNTRTITSIDEVGVTWTHQVNHVDVSGDYQYNVEIWLGVVGSGASTTITINLSGAPGYGAVADVCEYSGLLTSSYLDRTAVNDGAGIYGAIADTGTINGALTNELWIGGINSGQGMNTPTNGFTLLDGVRHVAGYEEVACGYLEKISATGGTINSEVTLTGSSFYSGVVAAFKSSSSSIASDIMIDPSTVIGINNLTLGTQLTYYDMRDYPSDSFGKILMNDSGIKLVKVFDADFDAINTPLILSWNEITHTGTYNWAVLDNIVQAIYASGAEPLLVLMSSVPFTAAANTTVFANGMVSNSSFGGLPSPIDASSYCSSVVSHLQSQGHPVRYYEISNEPESWLCPDGWVQTLNAQSQLRTGYFSAIYNASVTAMKQVNSTVSTSFDFSWQTGVMTWWLANYAGVALDRIDFHRYASNYIDEYTNATLMSRSNSMTADNSGGGFWLESNPVYAQQMYLSAKGVTLPLFDTENGICSQSGATDNPLMVDMFNAVFTANLLRTEILNNVHVSVHYDWQAYLPYEQGLSPPTYGFGLINSDNHQAWYPYYAYRMIGQHLQVGDEILSSTNIVGDVSCLAWNNSGHLNILLVHTANNNTAVTVGGISGNFSFEKIDNTHSFLTAQLQTGTLNSSSPITMNGYTVLFLTSGNISPLPVITSTITYFIYLPGIQTSHITSYNGVAISKYVGIP